MLINEIIPHARLNKCKKTLIDKISMNRFAKFFTDYFGQSFLTELALLLQLIFILSEYFPRLLLNASILLPVK